MLFRIMWPESIFRQRSSAVKVLLNLHFYKQLYIFNFSFISLAGTSQSDTSPSPMPILETVSLDQSICYTCMQEFPPCKGRGKNLRKATKIDLVGCDSCGRWYHCLCINVKLKDIGVTYICGCCSTNMSH